MTPTAVSEERGQFLAHRRYVRSFAVMCGHIHGHPYNRVWQDLTDLVGLAPPLEASGAPNLVVVRKRLASAWGTEYLLALNHRYAREDDIVRLTNIWAVVQTYYVHYHAIHALLAALGRDQPSTHAKTQAAFASTWAGRAHHVPPCSFGWGFDGAMNAPSGIRVDTSVHPWSNADEQTCYSLAAKALRTTRDEALRIRKGSRRVQKQRTLRREWERDEEERLAAGKRPRKPRSFPLPTLGRIEHKEIDRRMRVFSLMDYLYRLRVKSNYLDSTMFTEGPEQEDESLGLLQDLKDLAGNVLLVHELNVREAVSQDVFLKMIDEWIAPRGGPQLGVAERRSILAG